MTDKMSEHRSQSASALRRINKPLMEKKRRARINTCLGQLKSLVLEAMKKDPSRYSKLEKADILEMTVKHLRDIQRQSLSVAASSDPTVVPKYRSGYTECAKEVTRYLSSIEGVAPDVRMRVLQHLNGCVGQMTNPTLGLPHATHVPMQPISVHIPSATTMTSLPGAPRLMTQSPTHLQTVMTPEGTQIQGTFQLLSGPYPGGNGITVFIPSPRGSQGSSARSSPTSSISDISPASSPEPTPRPLTAAEKKQGVSPSFSYGGSGPYAPSHIPAGVSVARDINHNDIAVCKEEKVWRPW